MARQTKTPAQRAQEALDVENRRVKKLEGKANTLKTELEGTDRELVAARKRRDYLAQNPDLPTPPKKSAAAAPSVTEPAGK